MKKLSLMLILGIFMVSLISASCVNNNDFEYNDEINVCAVGCKYQNESNLSQYVDCDSSVSCSFSAFYPDGSEVVVDKAMERTGQTLNYSLGYLETNLSNVTGIYTGQIRCERVQGWMPPIYFAFSISEKDNPQGFKTPPGVDIEELKSAVTGSFIQQAKDYTKEKFDKYWVYFLFIGLILAFLLLGQKRRKEEDLNRQVRKEFKKWKQRRTDGN